MKIFIADDGSKWEVVRSLGMQNGALIIKQLKENKRTYTMQFDKFGGSDTIIDRDYKFTPEQAKKVAEAIEALMEYVTTSKDTNLMTMANIAREELLND